MPVVNLPGFENVAYVKAQLDPGTYTVTVKSWEEKLENDKNFLQMIYEVKEGPQQKGDLGGTHDPAGQEVQDRIYLTPQASWRIKQLLIASGLLSRNDKDSPIAKGQIDLDLLASAGAFQIKLTPRLAKDDAGNVKEYRNVEFVV